MAGATAPAILFFGLGLRLRTQEGNAKRDRSFYFGRVCS
jgi:hypothetical protein